MINGIFRMVVEGNSPIEGAFGLGPIIFDVIRSSRWISLLVLWSSGSTVFRLLWFCSVIEDEDTWSTLSLSLSLLGCRSLGIMIARQLFVNVCRILAVLILAAVGVNAWEYCAIIERVKSRTTPLFMRAGAIRYWKLCVRALGVCYDIEYVQWCEWVQEEECGKRNGICQAGTPATVCRKSLFLYGEEPSRSLSLRWEIVITILNIYLLPRHSISFNEVNCLVEHYNGRV